MIELGEFTSEQIKKGNRIIGELRTYEGGIKVYMAVRKLADIARGGHTTISEGIRGGVAGWGLDDATLFSVRCKVIPFIGISVKDTGDLYLTAAENYFTTGPDKRWFMQAIRKNGPMHRVLPLDAFRFRPGSKKAGKRGA